MLLFLRALPTLVLLWLLLAFYAITRWPINFWYFASIASFVALAGLWHLARKVKIPASPLRFIVIPGIFLIMSFGVMLFLERLTLQYVFGAIIALLFSFLLEQVFRFAYQPGRYQPHALLNLTTLLSAVGMFFGTLVLFNLQLFVGIQLWLILILYLFFQGTWILGFSWIEPMARGKRKPWVLVYFILGQELFILLLWLPALPLVRASIFLAAFGLGLQVYNADMHNEGQIVRLRWTFILYALVLLSIVASARWFV
jgi:hypothetical protein